MKRFFLLFTLLLPLVSYAQSQEQFDGGHLTFKGISISGSLDNFVDNLVKQGYELKESDSEGALFKGGFASEQDCKIYVGTTPKTHTVYSVGVFFNEKTSWSSLKSQYFEYKSMLSAKYGEPAKRIERFYSPYYEGDNFEMQALRMDKCTYGSLFIVSNGTIMLSISNDGSLLIYYEDKTGSDLNDLEKRQNAMSDL